MRPLRTSCQRGARDRERIDAVMRAEALVLVGDQQVEIARIDVRDGRRQPPASVRRRIGPQQAAVAVDHDGGEFEASPSGTGPREWTQTAKVMAVMMQRADSGCGDDAELSPHGRCRSLPRSPVKTANAGRGEGVRSVDCPHSPPPLTPPHKGGGSAPPDLPSLTSRPRSPPSRRRCGRSGRDDTCPPHRPAAARICRARPRARCRRR